jgi:uncharacterized protein YcbK (DUF882 family)
LCQESVSDKDIRDKNATEDGTGMRSFVLTLTATLAFAGTAYPQANTAGTTTPEIVRGGTADKAAASSTKVVRPQVQRAAAAQPKLTPQAQNRLAQAQQRTTKPETLRGSRYGGFAPVPSGPPPVLDTTSPRTLSLVNFNTQDTLTVTYWSNGAYHRDALDKLNFFLRDSQNNSQTEMDPLLFDVLWHTTRIVGYGGSIEVLSAYRSPEHNAWLASVSRGVARDSQHMNGNAMDIRFPGVPVFQIRQAAYSLNMGGVGFYPRSGFVHLDTGPVRYW